MQPFPQLFTAAGGSGTYLTDSCSPTSPLERMHTEDASDVSILILLERNAHQYRIKVSAAGSMHSLLEVYDYL